MLRGYFDGSGKPHESDYLTLTGLVASESVWERFECSWSDVLRKYQIPAFHMTDAMSLKKRFSPQNGWSRGKVAELVKDLWNVIGKYRWTDDVPVNSNLNACSCTVVMSDYRRAKLQRPRLREPEALCTAFCLHGIPFDLDSRLEHPEIILTFDRGEAFRKTVYRGWVKFKKLTNAGWPKQFKKIEAGSAADKCPIQAADLVAWTLNKHHKTPDGYPETVGLVIMLSHQMKVFDYETIMRTPDSLICFQ
jgi:hypothetical protein